MFRINNLSQLLIPFEDLSKFEVKLNLVKNMQEPYLRLVEYINQIIGFFPSTKEEWTYETDSSTGLRILKVTKNSRALYELDKMTKEFYK